MRGRAARLGRAAWLVGYLAVIIVPLVLVWVVGRDPGDDLLAISATDTGLLAFSLLVVALVLMARVPSLVASFGIETILRMHRVVALCAVALVAGHVVLIVFHDPRGLSIFDLRDTTAAAWAATISTVALATVVGFALRRKRRQPRYEGWRMLHIALAATVFLGAWLHIWWLDQLSANVLTAIWFVLMGLVVLAVAARRWVWLPVRAHRRSYIVDQVIPVSGNAVTLAMKAHGHEGVRFKAGQFAWLKIGSSSFVFEEHPFTIASTADAPHRKEFTIKALGDFSELLRGLRPGRRVFMDGPYGRFTIEGLDSSEGFVFIAGGVGVTPMVSMLRTLNQRRDPRPHLLLLGARSLEDLMLHAEVDRLREGLDLTVTPVLESPPEDWDGEQGRIDAELLDRCLPRHSKQHDYFLCGPPPMVIAVGKQLRDRGIPLNRIHTERFEVV
ncbi:MAG TPA: ferredoxin reductase family protein [Nocardioidaceae bacterium]|nr:ferredoxin reductase family protein [Nocardioidaceae bacterium]